MTTIERIICLLAIALIAACLFMLVAIMTHGAAGWIDRVMDNYDVSDTVSLVIITGLVGYILTRRQNNDQ